MHVHVYSVCIAVLYIVHVPGYTCTCIYIEHNVHLFSNSQGSRQLQNMLVCCWTITLPLHMTPRLFYWLMRYMYMYIYTVDTMYMYMYMYPCIYIYVPFVYYLCTDSHNPKLFFTLLTVCMYMYTCSWIYYGHASSQFCTTCLTGHHVIMPD